MRMQIVIPLALFFAFGCELEQQESPDVYDDSDSGFDAGSDTGVDSDDTEPETDTETEIDTETYASDTETEWETGVETDSETEVETDSYTDTDTESDGDTELETDTDTDTDLTGSCTGPGLYLTGDGEWSRCWDNDVPIEQMDFDAAAEYCENLILDGSDDWRLPNINELKLLIEGCPQGAGYCWVYEDQEGNSFPDVESWTDAECQGCEFDEGPGLGGCYWGTGITGSCGVYWSTTEARDQYLATYKYWTVWFAVGIVEPTADFLGAEVRCIREM